MRTAAHVTATIIFFGLLCLPMSAMLVDWAPTTQLGGVEDSDKEPVTPAWDTWFSGELAASTEALFRRHLGLRSLMVKTDNQITLSVFSTLKAPNILGRDDQLFLSGYAPGRSWLHSGRRESLEQLVPKLAAAQAACELAGIAFIPIVSPIKTRHLAEQLPYLLRQAAHVEKRTVYDEFKRLCQLQDVRFLDCPALFEQWIHEEGPPLFPKGGIHWSNYGAAKVVVELIDTVAEMTGREFTRFDLTGYEWEEKPRGQDRDLAQLISVWDEERFWGRTARPLLTKRPGSGDRPPRILLVGTSFVANLANSMKRDHVLGSVDYFRYNRNHYIHGPKKDRLVGPVPDETKAEFLTFLLQYDAVILEAAEHVVDTMNWENFLDNVVLAAEAAGKRARERQGK